MPTKSTASIPLKNQKHEKFAQLIADGKSETDAYIDVYKCTKRVAKSSAPRLLSNVVVRARARWLQEQNAKVAALSREESMQILAKIARGGDGSISMQDRIRAIQENNRMNGWSSENFNVKGEGIVFDLGKVFGGGKD